MQPVSPPGAGTLEPIRTWPLRVPDQTTGSLTDVCLKFPQSQHRPSLITAAKLMAPIPSKPVKQCNLCKVDWKHYNLLTNEATQSLISSSTTNVEEAYQDFCSALIKVAKRSIPQDRRNNYILCWDMECESLYRTFLEAPYGEKSYSAAIALLSHLDQQKHERWNEAIDSIHFSHSSCLVWSTLNRQTHLSLMANFRKLHHITSCEKQDLPCERL